MSGVVGGYLARALEEGERVRRVLRQLLDFSRPARAERVALDLCRLAEETAGLVRSQRRYAQVAIEVMAEGEPPLAFADRNQVVQIVLNLLLNAADALAATPDARIRLTLRGVPGTVRAGEAATAARGRGHFDFVECRIADNGPGVAAEDRVRIFDPFFSTKKPGEGTGLGLSNALRFAEELGGALTLEDAGPGAVFALRLPAARESGAGGGAVR